MKHFRSKDDVLTWYLARRHNDRDREIYRIAIKKWIETINRKDYIIKCKELIIHKNKDFTDRFKIIPPNLYHSHMFGTYRKDGHYYIHYDLNKPVLTSELRLQSFPDNLL